MKSNRYLFTSALVITIALISLSFFGCTDAPAPKGLDSVQIIGLPFEEEQLTAELSPTAAVATYQWLRADSKDGAYSSIEGATAQSYTLTAADKDKYIKAIVTRVVAAGVGSNTGVKTAAATIKIGSTFTSAFPSLADDDFTLDPSSGEMNLQDGYEITGIFTVPEEITLIVKPGESLKIAAGSTISVEDGGTLEVNGELILDGTLELANGWSDVAFGGSGTITISNNDAKINKGTTVNGLKWYTLSKAKAVYSSVEDEVQLEFIKNGDLATVTPRAANLSPTENQTNVKSGVAFNVDNLQFSIIAEQVFEIAGNNAEMNLTGTDEISNNGTLIITDGGALYAEGWFNNFTADSNGMITIMPDGLFYQSNGKVVAPNGPFQSYWGLEQHGTKTIITRANNWTFEAHAVENNSYLKISSASARTPMVIREGVTAIVDDEWTQTSSSADNSYFRNFGNLLITGSFVLQSGTAAYKPSLINNGKIAISSVKSITAESGTTMDFIGTFERLNNPIDNISVSGGTIDIADGAIIKIDGVVKTSYADKAITYGGKVSDHIVNLR